MMTKLYIKDARGDIRTWEIWSEPFKIVMNFGLEFGEKIFKTENVTLGKQSRTTQEQIDNRIKSRIKKMKDKGYVETREEALSGATNSLGLLKPMLAHALKNVRSIDWRTAVIQRKYDGHRCLVTRMHGENIAYSRNGKMIHSIDHILKHIQLEDGQTIDGELYHHGVRLQTISSWVKKDQAESKKLVYVVYDIMEYTPYLIRLGIIKEVVCNSNSIMVAPTRDCNSEEQALELMMKYKSEGYEGAIVRHGATHYEDGKRSKSLVKFKTVLDAIFNIVDVKLSKDGWAILVCETYDGKQFSVSAPGGMDEKYDVAANHIKYIGKDLRIEFANYTKDGIPFHPIATNYMD